MIVQMQVLDVVTCGTPGRNCWRTGRTSRGAGQVDPVVMGLGGGPRDLEVRVFENSPAGPMLIVHLVYRLPGCHGREHGQYRGGGLRPMVEEITGGRVLLRILSNLADRRLARARCRIPEASPGLRRIFW